MKRAWLKMWSNLSTRITVSLIGLVLLTALAVGAPAIILLRQQLDEQAWLQVQQTRKITKVLYAAKKSELAGLATLTAQRPTLAQLLQQSDKNRLLTYLQTLQLGTRLDGLLICTMAGEVVAQVGQPMPASICQATGVSPIFVDQDPTPPHVWLLASHQMANLPYQIIVGAALDSRFTQHLSEQTGLQQLLFWQKKQVASSLLLPFQLNITMVDRQLYFKVGDKGYYATLAILESPDLVIVIALDVSEIVQTQQQLSSWLSAAIVIIASLSSTLGVWLAHQISRPLAQLEAAAVHFSQGQLDTPVQVETQVREVRLLAETIELARVKLQQSLDVHRLLSHFLANITHEFRTPLSALNASIELLLDEAENLSAEEMRELLKPTHLSLISLQTLIDNLLESSSIEAGRFTIRPRPTELHHVLTEAIHIVRPLLERRRQTLTIAESLALANHNLQADPTRLVQVLVNLLSNASKYSPLGSEINLQVEEQIPPLAPPMSGNTPQPPPTSGGEEQARMVRILVADQGEGIPLAEQGQLFRRFVRLHNPNGEQYGVGLGLYVVKTIVAAHGGQVGVADRVGGGAVFWFELPLG